MAKKQSKNSHKADHLKKHQWKPGQSGNTGGRPKGTSLNDRIRKVLDENDGQVAEALVKAATAAALKGDFRFWNALVERHSGKVPDQVQGSGQVEVIVRYEDAHNDGNGED